MSAASEYAPPTSAEMAHRQLQLGPLRLLLAQRRLYTKAKFWVTARWVGMLVIAIGAPVVAFLVPEAATAMGALAGVWLFLGGTLLTHLQKSRAYPAAAVQEKFDREVFGMDQSIERSSLPSIDEIALLTGSDVEVIASAHKEGLTDGGGWYPIVRGQPSVKTIAICQRANVSYSNRLLRTTAAVWIVFIAVWSVALIVMSLVLDLSLGTFLLGIAFPLLPAFLDVAQYVSSLRRAAADRHDLAVSIENRIELDDVAAEDLLAWQETIFGIRRDTPEVPDAIYRLARRRNERAMHQGAAALRK